MVMSLETPEKIRSLQRKLYCKAKSEPAFRFYLLYDKICREDVLGHAYALARANAGAPGVDGVTFDEIEAWGVEAWLAGLREDLVAKTYRPDAVRRVMIPKPGGGERPLGIPTIRDRVVQTAAKIVLEPVFEADFEGSAYGYRPRRSAIDAVKEAHRLLCRGYTNVVDADLSRLASVDNAIGTVRQQLDGRKIDAIALNAGIQVVDGDRVSPDGIELSFELALVMGVFHAFEGCFEPVSCFRRTQISQGSCIAVGIARLTMHLVRLEQIRRAERIDLRTRIGERIAHGILSLGGDFPFE